MINDGRSGKVIFLVHCIINSNSICIGPKTPSLWPAVINEVVELLMRSNIGIIQLPCPEQLVFGLVRGEASRKEMDTPKFRKYCRKLAEHTIDLIEEYIKNGFKVVGFLGKRGSPTCSVSSRRKGILIEELIKAMNKRKVKISLMDFERTKIENCLSKLKEAIQASAN
jgi:predicted secreted protein